MTFLLFFISEPTTILDILEKDEDTALIYQFFKIAMEQYEAFEYLLEQTVYNLTVFAPTNAAFLSLNISEFSNGGEIDLETAEMLLYHVIEGSMLTRDVFAQLHVCDSIPTLNNLISSENNSLRIHPSTDQSILNVNAAQVILNKSNKIARNGVVHVVDEVCFLVK